jgi:Phage tail lysozyme
VAKDHLQEYLIGLGFDVDQNKLRKFREGAAVAAKEVTELGGAAIATATALGYMVTKAARQFEALYYQSQRTGLAVTKLKAFEFASRQVGVAAEEASASTEAFFAGLRTNPGLKGLAGVLGVGPGGGPLQLVQSLKRKFGESQYFIAARFGEQFGIPEQTFRQYWDNLDRTIAEQDRWEKSLQAAGLSGPQVAENFLQLSRQVSAIEDHFSIAGSVIAKDFLPILQKIAPEVENLIKSFAKADADSGGTLGVASGAGVAGLPLLLLKSVRGFAARLLGKGGGAMGPALEVMELMKHDSQNGNQVRTWLRGVLGIEDPGEAASWAGAKPGGGKVGSASGAIDYFVSQGWTPAQAAGIAANLSRESGFNPRSVGDNGSAFGIAQWHADRQADFKRQFGKDIRESTLEEQLAFVQYELTKGKEQFAGAKLRQTRTAEEAGSAVSQFYERPKSVAEASANRALQARQLFDANIAPSPLQTAGAAVTINHDTDINLFGNADKAAQQAIVNSQYDIYSQAVRNNLPRTR